MAKDPAFLFYSDNFMSGTMFFTHEQTGKYIRLLCAQHLTGHLSEKDMLKICLTKDEDIWAKFKVDPAGKFFQERLELEIIKRKAFSESRSNNRSGKNKQVNKKSKTYVKHMEDGNENGNGNVIEIGIEERKTKFLMGLSLFRQEHSDEVLNEFGAYWVEHNPDGKKMRFEMEKVFDISRRLRTWVKNDFSKNGKQTSTKQPKGGDTDADLAAALAKYR